MKSLLSVRTKSDTHTKTQILFVDDDVDRFVCENIGKAFALPLFSKVRRAGATRIDIWRLLVMQKYGGV